MMVVAGLPDLHRQQLHLSSGSALAPTSSLNAIRGPGGSPVGWPEMTKLIGTGKINMQRGFVGVPSAWWYWLGAGVVAF